MRGLEVYLAKLFHLVWIMHHSPRRLCSLLLLLLLLLRCMLLTFWSAFLTGDLGQRSKHLAVRHGDGREEANQRILNANRNLKGVEMAQWASRSDRIHEKKVVAEFMRVRVCCGDASRVDRRNAKAAPIIRTCHRGARPTGLAEDLIHFDLLFR